MRSPRPQAVLRGASPVAPAPAPALAPPLGAVTPLASALTLEARLARAERLGHRPAALRVHPDREPATVRRMEDAKAAATQAAAWRKLATEESVIIAGINELLRAFSSLASLANYDKTTKEIDTKKARLKEINEAHAGIVGEYLAAGGDVRTAFIRALFADLPEDFGKGKFEPEGLEDEPTYDAAWLQSMFDALATKTRAASEEEAPYRLRYLSYSLQSLNDPLGANQIRHLLALLGDEGTLTIAEGVKTDMSAGPHVGAEEDPAVKNAKVTKTDTGGKDDDQGILDDVGGNLYKFMQRKYGAEVARTANARASEVRDFQINLDKETYLFPIFAGIADEKLVLFTTPKFMSVHHENGHLITMMQGKAGIGDQHAYEGALKTLTSQEEAYNIFGAPRSDRAYSEATGLPVRFDHKTLLTYIKESSDWEAWAHLLAQGSSLAGNLPTLQARLVKQLTDLIAANWGGKTWVKSKPKGVVKVGEEMAKVKAADAKLAAAQKQAASSGKEKSKNRDPLTQSFYDAVGALEVANAESLLATEASLAGIRAKL